MCGKKFETEYLDSLYSNKNNHIGILHISIKEAIISIKIGEYEEVKQKITSGISNQHKKGGSSSGRFYRTREMEIDTFFKRVKTHMISYDVTSWEIYGEKDTVKRFNYD